MITFGRLAVAAAVIAGAFTFIDASARDAAPAAAPAVKVAETAQPAMRGTLPAPTAEACTRKVKIVYGGEGEVPRAGCPATGG